MKFVYFQNFAKKKKKKKLGPKNIVLDILGLEIEKKLSYLKSAPFEFWLKKSLNLGTNILVSVFLGGNLKATLSYLKSAQLNFPNSKILQKQCLNLGPKMPYLGIFCLQT